MKLLLDQNLSPRLITKLQDIFPDSTHVQWVGLDGASDQAVWHYAEQNQFCIVTKDADFSERSLLLKSPPKVLWIRLGNCTTSDIEKLLRRNIVAINRFATQVDIDVLSIF